MSAAIDLDTLPELGLEHGTRLVVRDGRLLKVPLVADRRELSREPHEPVSYLDANGDEWEVGRIDGRQVKRRRASF